MVGGVKIIDEEFGICEELWFTEHAIWAQRASKVVNHVLWGPRPSGNHRGKHIISSLTPWDAVEPIADDMGAPHSHDPPGKPVFAVLIVIF